MLESNRKTFTLDDRVLKKLMGWLHEHGLKVDTLQLLKFIENGIIMRELAKFNFSHCLSDALEILASFGRDSRFIEKRWFIPTYKCLRNYIFQSTIRKRKSL